SLHAPFSKLAPRTRAAARRGLRFRRPRQRAAGRTDGPGVAGSASGASDGRKPRPRRGTAGPRLGAGMAQTPLIRPRAIRPGSDSGHARLMGAWGGSMSGSDSGDLELVQAGRVKLKTLLISTIGILACVAAGWYLTGPAIRRSTSWTPTTCTISNTQVGES